MSDVHDEARSPIFIRYQVLALLFLAAVIAYIQRSVLSVPAAEIAKDLQFKDLANDMGSIQSAWYFSYALMQLPSGWVADRFGSRRTLAALCVLWSCATLVAGFATDYYSLIVLWSFMGAAQAGIFPCSAKAIGQIFPDTERARASGLLGCGTAVGAAISSTLTASLLVLFNPFAESLEVNRWRLVFAVYAIPGVLWAAVFLLVVSKSRLPVTSDGAKKVEAVDWTRMLRSGSLILLCSQQFFRAAGMVFFLTWFPTFLQKTRDVSTFESGYLTSFAGLGAVLGSVTGGFASDALLRRTGNSRLSRQGIAVVGMGCCSLLIITSYLITDVRTSTAVISLGGFCAAFGGVSGYTVAINFGGRHVAKVFSSMNMCGNLGAALFPLVAGWLVAATGNWNLILFLFAAIMAVDAVCWAFLNPKGTLFGDEVE